MKMIHMGSTATHFVVGGACLFGWSIQVYGPDTLAGGDFACMHCPLWDPELAISPPQSLSCGWGLPHGPVLGLDVHDGEAVIVGIHTLQASCICKLWWLPQGPLALALGAPCLQGLQVATT